MSKQKKSAAFDVECPHCQAKLTVDPGVQAILEHEPPPDKSAFDFDAQLKGLGEAEAKRDALFKEQIEAQKKHSNLLDAKFRESFEKHKDEPAEKPIRDMDLD